MYYGKDNCFFPGELKKHKKKSKKVVRIKKNRIFAPP